MKGDTMYKVIREDGRIVVFCDDPKQLPNALISALDNVKTAGV